ncbi:hypothetical protein PAJ_2062 [Pantoea ananatis AJ13355]|uniref:Uncharacterized protein n=1 Tax=Pantoea ananatis (strain AJ13355) TaxID=932677 RepID=A0A0H3L2Q9_PANAA|nr:hypothetical protein PAJ_2062 [Pantoea ananatis AJ13355]
MPVQRILFETVKRCHIEAAAKPPDRLGTWFFGNKETHVGMAGRHIGIVRMNHQRHAHGFKTAPGQFRPMRGSGRGHLIAMNVRKVDAGLFKDGAITQHAASSAAAAGALPAVFNKMGTAVFGGQLATNLILQIQQERFYTGDIWHVMSFSW